MYGRGPSLFGREEKDPAVRRGQGLGRKHPLSQTSLFCDGVFRPSVNEGRSDDYANSAIGFYSVVYATPGLFPVTRSQNMRESSNRNPSTTIDLRRLPFPPFRLRRTASVTMASNMRSR